MIGPGVLILLTCLAAGYLVWLVDRFVWNLWLANALHIVVVTICFVVILRWILPLLGVAAPF